jgi:hypothetical protein
MFNIVLSGEQGFCFSLPVRRLIFPTRYDFSLLIYSTVFLQTLFTGKLIETHLNT